MEWELAVWSMRFLRLSVFNEATSRCDDLFCVKFEYCAKRSAYCFCLKLLRVIWMVKFCTTMEIQASSLARERLVPFVNVNPAEGLRPVKVLFILIEAEVARKVNLLRDGEVD